MYKGDLIILASDGMFDVVQDSLIEKVVNNRNENVIHQNCLKFFFIVLIFFKIVY